MKSKKFTLILTLVLVLVLSACSSNNSSSPSNNQKGSNNGTNSSSTNNDSTNTEERKPVKVVTSTIPLPAFWDLDANGEGTGYAADYIALLEEKLPQYEFQYEPGDGTAQLVGVETGKYAMAAYTWFKNAEREDKYIFTEPFGYSYTVLVTKGDRDDVKTLEDVAGKTVVPMTPNSGLRNIITKFNDENPGKEIVVENVDKYTIPEDLKSVASGKYDVDFKNLTAVTEVNKELGLDIKIASVVSKEPVYFLFNKNEAELAADVEAVTKELIADGTLSELSIKWFGFDNFKEIDDVQAYFDGLNS